MFFCLLVCSKLINITTVSIKKSWTTAMAHSCSVLSLNAKRMRKELCPQSRYLYQNSWNERSQIIFFLSLSLSFSGRQQENLQYRHCIDQNRTDNARWFRGCSVRSPKEQRRGPMSLAPMFSPSILWRPGMALIFPSFSAPTSDWKDMYRRNIYKCGRTIHMFCCCLVSKSVSGPSLSKLLEKRCMSQSLHHLY